MDLVDIQFEIAKHLPLIDVLLLNKYRIFNVKINIREEIERRFTFIGVLFGEYLLSILLTPRDEDLIYMPNGVDIISKDSHLPGYDLHTMKFHNGIPMLTYRNGNEKVNLFWIKDCTVEEVMDSLDSDLLRCHYDGTTLYIKDPKMVHEYLMPS